MKCHGVVGAFWLVLGWWVGRVSEPLLLDACWDNIVGRGKVSRWDWLLGRRGLNKF